MVLLKASQAPESFGHNSWVNLVTKFRGKASQSLELPNSDFLPLKSGRRQTTALLMKICHFE